MYNKKSIIIILNVIHMYNDKSILIIYNWEIMIKLNYLKLFEFQYWKCTNKNKYYIFVNNTFVVFILHRNFSITRNLKLFYFKGYV